MDGFDTVRIAVGAADAGDLLADEAQALEVMRTCQAAGSPRDTRSPGAAARG